MTPATATSTAAPSELLQYLPDYRVLVCKQCRYAIQPSAISRHLKDLHSIYRSDRQHLLESTESLDLADPADVVLPKPTDPPVSLLPFENGLACAANGCNHLCITAKRMKSHWATVHKDLIGVQATQWHLVTLQTFFRGNQLRYFRVKVTPIDVPLKSTPGALLDELTVESPPSSWTTDEVALYNHFIQSTNQTITCYPDSQKLWLTVIPQMSYEHDFLKHAILACSALHLAYLIPSHRHQYRMVAATHQDQALPLFREATASPTDENCNALLAFSHLLVIHCFGSEELDEDLLFLSGNHHSGLPEWLQIIRSSCSMFAVVRQTLANGNLRPLVDEGLQAENLGSFPDPDPDPGNPYAKQLFQLFNGVPPFGKESLLRKAQGGYAIPWTGALLELNNAFKKARIARSRGTYTLWTAVQIWPAKITMNFLGELIDRDPAALVLLAHYCLLLEPLEEYWYLNGFSKRLLMRIYEQLDEEWRPWLKWPFEMAGIEP